MEELCLKERIQRMRQTRIERLEKFIRDWDSVSDYLKHLTRDTYNYYKNELRKEQEYEARTFTESEDEFVTI